MLDQDEPRGKRRVFVLRDIAGVLGDRVCVVDTVGNHLSIGDTTHARLIEDRGGALIEMYAAMPQAVFAGRVETIIGFGHMGQVLQWIDRRARI
ncbi:hypothetical protein D3C85_1122390 [compost metagenome]